MYFISNGVEIIKFAIMYEMGLQLERRKEKKYFVLAGICYVVASIIMNALPDTVNPLGIYVAFMIAETMILYKEKILTQIFMAVWTMGAIGVVDGTIYISLKLSINQQLSFFNKMADIIVGFITISFFFVLFKSFGKKNQYPLKYVKRRYLIYVFGVGIINELVITLLLGFVDSKAADIKGSALSISFFCIVGLFFQLAFVIQLAVTNQALKEKEEVIKKSLKMQEENYKYLEKKEQETRKFRHDIRKHLFVIEKLGRDGAYEEQQKYLQTILGKVESQKNYITVHNGIVDAILNRYLEISREEGILLQIKGKMPDVCYMEPYDLCTIFANLLENAIEAVRKTKDKKILLTIGYEDNTILIKEENSYNGTLDTEKGYMKTTKKEANMHGYGLKNMEESILHYNGIMNYYTESELFVMEIMIYNEAPQ